MLKRFKIISDRYRNRRKRFSLRFNLLAGLYNYELFKIWEMRFILRRYTDTAEQGVDRSSPRTQIAQQNRSRRRVRSTCGIWVVPIPSPRTRFGKARWVSRGQAGNNDTKCFVPDMSIFGSIISILWTHEGFRRTLLFRSTNLNRQRMRVSGEGTVRSTSTSL